MQQKILKKNAVGGLRGEKRLKREKRKGTLFKGAGSD